MWVQTCCTSLHVGKGAVIGVQEGHAVVVEDHVVLDGRQDARHEGLADLAAVAVAMALQEFGEGCNTPGLPRQDQPQSFAAIGVNTSGT